MHDGQTDARYVTNTVSPMTNYLNVGDTIVPERAHPLLPPSGILHAIFFSEEKSAARS